MRALILCLFLVGCSGIKYAAPVSQFDLADNACVEGRGEHDGVIYNLYLTDDVDQLYDWCGDAAACVVGIDIYSPIPCERHLAHEINHLQGNHWVDRPRINL